MSKKKRPFYTKAQIYNFQDFEAHQRIMQHLVELLYSGENLSQLELEVICGAIELSDSEEGKPQLPSSCSDYRFKMLILQYQNDLSVFNTEIDRLGNDIPYEQRVKDMDVIRQHCKDWYDKVQITNHKEPILQAAAVECRKQLKELEKQPEFNVSGSLVKSNLYLKREMMLLAKSKYAYLLTLGLFEYCSEADLLFEIDGYGIKYMPISHMHIIIRHFGQKLAGYDTGKSIHDFDIPYEEVNSFLKEIAEKIHDTRVTSVVRWEDKRGRILFRYNGKPYALYIQHESNNGSTPLYRVSTFYRVDQDSQLDEISRLDELTIDSQLSVFLNR